MVSQKVGLVEPARGLYGADFLAPVQFEPLLQMKIDRVEIGHKSLCFIGDADGGLPDDAQPCQCRAGPGRNDRQGQPKRRPSGGGLN